MWNKKKKKENVSSHSISYYAYLKKFFPSDHLFSRLIFPFLPPSLPPTHRHAHPFSRQLTLQWFSIQNIPPSYIIISSRFSHFSHFIRFPISDFLFDFWFLLLWLDFKQTNKQTNKQTKKQDKIPIIFQLFFCCCCSFESKKIILLRCFQDFHRFIVKERRPTDRNSYLDHHFTFLIYMLPKQKQNQKKINNNDQFTRPSRYTNHCNTKKGNKTF